MLSNPVIATLLNQETGRWHPTLFIESPVPGNAKTIRHKSKGHHTDGLDTKELADQYAKDHWVDKVPGVRLELDTVFQWDGSGIPAIVAFFEAPALAGTC